MAGKIQLTLLTLLIIGMVGPVARAQELPRTISVTGTALTRVVPDIITWHISTNDYERELLVAKESNDQKLKAIFALVDELEIAPEDMQTGSLRVRKVYNRDERGNQLDFKHFAISRSVTLRQRDLKRFDEFFSALLTSAEMDVNFSHESTKVHEHRWETRLKAVRLAKEKAEAMAELVGAEIGKAIAINEHSPSESSRRDIRDINNPAPYRSRDAVEDLVGGTFAPGSISVKITVYVTFELI